MSLIARCNPPEPARVPLVPGRLPLTGHARDLNRDPLAFVERVRAYGPVVRILVGPRTVYVANSPELIRAVLTRPGFDKGIMNDTLSGPLGDGLVTSGGELHRRQRRLVQPGFHAERVAGYVALMAERSAARARSWSAGGPLDLVDEINKLTLDILLQTLFAGEPGPRLRTAVTEWLAVKYRSIRTAFSPMVAWSERIPVLPGWQPPDPGPLDRLRAVQQEFVAEYRAAGEDRGDLLSMLVHAEGPDGSMSDRQVGDELITLFLAGTGTVSAALEWTMYEVARNPEAQRLVQQEVADVLGGRAPTVADLPALTYCRRVATEALRLHPVAWIDMRRTTTRQRLGPYDVPGHAEFFVSPYGLHRDPLHYPDPLDFRPERWPADRPVRGPREAYLPFGAGNRLCLGEDYAWTLLVVALAAFASRWRFTLAPGEPIRALAGTVLRPERLPMTLEQHSVQNRTERQDEHVVNS